MITASDAEGAGAMFAVSTLLEASGEGDERRFQLKSPDPKDDFFGNPEARQARTKDFLNKILAH